MSPPSLHRSTFASTAIDANRRWVLEIAKEATTTAIALSVTGSFLYASIQQIDSPALTNVAILIIGYFFGSAAKSAGNFARRQHRTNDEPGVSPAGPVSVVSGEPDAAADPL